jgi:hypothetical protein
MRRGTPPDGKFFPSKRSSGRVHMKNMNYSLLKKHKGYPRSGMTKMTRRLHKAFQGDDSAENPSCAKRSSANHMERLILHPDMDIWFFVFVMCSFSIKIRPFQFDGSGHGKKHRMPIRGRRNDGDIE